MKEIGKVKLPSPYPHCLIEVQWGTTRGGTTVTFPVSFTTLFSLSAVQQYAGYFAQGAAVNNWSSSKFTANSSSENGHGNQYIFWIAIGK